jgi:hypothetical protein
MDGGSMYNPHKALVEALKILEDISGTPQAA